MVAFGFAGLADVPAMEKQPVMGFGDDVSGDVFDQLALRLQRVFAAGGEAKAFGDTEYMGVHCHGGLLPNDRTDNIRRLASDTLERLQVFDVIGYFALIDFHQALCHLYQVFGFGAWVTDRFDVFEDFVRGGLCEGFGGGESFKEGRSDHIHPLVGALGGKHYRYQQFIGIAVVQFALSHRHVGFEPGEDIFIAFRGRHFEGASIRHFEVSVS